MQGQEAGTGWCRAGVGKAQSTRHETTIQRIPRTTHSQYQLKQRIHITGCIRYQAVNNSCLHFSARTRPASSFPNPLPPHPPSPLNTRPLLHPPPSRPLPPPSPLADLPIPLSLPSTTLPRTFKIKGKQQLTSLAAANPFSLAMTTSSRHLRSDNTGGRQEAAIDGNVVNPFRRKGWRRGGRKGVDGWGGGGCTQFVYGRSRITIDPRIPTMPGRSTSGFYQPGRQCLHQARSAVRCSASRMKGELHPSKNR